MSVELVGARDHATEQPEHRVPLGMHLDVLMHGHPDAGEHEQRPEDVDRPAEGLQQGGASGDEDRSKDQRSEHSPEQHAMLVLGRHREVPEDQCEDKDVVDRQRLLDQVSREVLTGEIRPLPGPDHHAERQPQRYPHGTPCRGLLRADDVRIPVEHEQIDRQHPQDERDERCPDPEIDLHGYSSLGSRSRAWSRDRRPKVFPARWRAASPGWKAGLTTMRSGDTPLRSAQGTASLPSLIEAGPCCPRRKAQLGNCHSCFRAR